MLGWLVCREIVDWSDLDEWEWEWLLSGLYSGEKSIGSIGGQIL